MSLNMSSEFIIYPLDIYVLGRERIDSRCRGFNLSGRTSWLSFFLGFYLSHTRQIPGWHLQLKPWSTPSRILPLPYPGLSLRYLKAISKFQIRENSREGSEKKWPEISQGLSWRYHPAISLVWLKKTPGETWQLRWLYV